MESNSTKQRVFLVITGCFCLTLSLTAYDVKAEENTIPNTCKHYKGKKRDVCAKHFHDSCYSITCEEKDYSYNPPRKPTAEEIKVCLESHIAYRCSGYGGEENQLCIEYQRCDLNRYSQPLEVKQRCLQTEAAYNNMKYNCTYYWVDGDEVKSKPSGWCDFSIDVGLSGVYNFAAFGATNVSQVGESGARLWIQPKYEQLRRKFWHGPAFGVGFLYLYGTNVDGSEKVSEFFPTIDAAYVLSFGLRSGDQIVTGAGPTWNPEGIGWEGMLTYAVEMPRDWYLDLSLRTGSISPPVTTEQGDISHPFIGLGVGIHNNLNPR